MTLVEDSIYIFDFLKYLEVFLEDFFNFHFKLDSPHLLGRGHFLVTFSVVPPHRCFVGLVSFLPGWFGSYLLV